MKGAEQEELRRRDRRNQKGNGGRECSARDERTTHKLQHEHSRLECGFSEIVLSRQSELASSVSSPTIRLKAQQHLSERQALLL